MAGARLGVDVGGTFTDLVALVDGELRTAKVPSTPADQSEGVLASVEAAGLAAGDVDAFAHGMTVGTNALLERRGARTALVTTEGFRDVLEIGRQVRPSLYDLTKDRPEPLIPRDLRFTVAERMGPEGELKALEDDSVRSVVEAVRDADVEAVAVCLLFAFMHPEHEARVGEALRDALDGVRVSLSSDVLPEFREYERFATTAVDAYLGPKLAAYLERLAERCSEAGLPEPLVMQSSGGVVSLGAAVDGAAACVLSGPAGGVIGAGFVARASGYDDVLTFDMGGTSTDVAPIVDGEASTTNESVVAGEPIRLPVVDVHTVSAGGGSIAWADEGGALRVGPRSAGADPGPAAYGRGGEEPTVTDANLVLGHLEDGATLGGEVTLDAAAAEQALASLGERLGLDALETARGIVRVADAEMVRALRVISVQRGLDPRDFALVAFGGAGGLHACSLAEELGMTTVLVPRAAGVLSALGLAISDVRRDYMTPALAPLSELDPSSFAALEEAAQSDLHEPSLRRRADLRYRGQSFELTVDADSVDDLAERFHAAHEQRYGYRMEGEAIETVSLRVVATVEVEKPSLSEAPGETPSDPSRRRMWVDGEWVEVPAYARDDLGAGSSLSGPCLVDFAESTLVVADGWSGEVDDAGTVVLHAMSLDPVTLSVLASALRGVAEEMGAVLIRGAYSSNIKERRDCSTALFDAEGRLLAQAEHIPVHLGAMPEAVAAVMERSPGPGDVFCLNDPYTGGTHLPDLTLVSPMALDDEVIGYAVTRAHHSDVGGMRPGSMPADSREIYQEGLIIPPLRIARAGEPSEEALELLLANVRTPDVRRGDLRAQIAANRLAERRLRELIERRGRDVIEEAFSEVLEYAERRTREVLRGLPDGEATAEGEIEGDGTVDEDIPLRARVKLEGDTLSVDFEGTADQVGGNVNCPLAVTRSACCFALRVLLPDDVLANAGAYAPLSISAPEGSLVNAQRPAAVVAGNVETSQRIADTVLRALGEVVAGSDEAARLPADGQGTMNNLVIGGPGWTYYETIGGGQGASARGDGPSGVHVGMSNTLNTPVEALELEYPLRVERYELLEGSGGSGEHRGGDGIVRAVRTLEDAWLSLLSDRRRHGPRGKEGGSDGACGANSIDEEGVGPKTSRALREGSVVEVRTPGGGGYGTP